MTYNKNNILFAKPKSVQRFRASLRAQVVKILPTMQKTWVQSLGQEDPLEKGMATHSSILAWRIPRTEEPGGPIVHEVAQSHIQLSN